MVRIGISLEGGATEFADRLNAMHRSKRSIRIDSNTVGYISLEFR